MVNCDMSDYSFGDSGLKHGFNKRDEDSISSFFKDLGDKPVRHQVRQPVEPDLPGLEDLNKDVRPAKRIREHTPESDTPDFFDDSDTASYTSAPEYTGFEEHDDYATSEEELAIHHAGEDIREMPSSSGSSSSQNSSEAQPEEQSEEQDGTNDDKQDDSKDETDTEGKDNFDEQEDNGDTQQEDASHESDEKRGIETAGSNEGVQSNETTQSTESFQSSEEKPKDSEQNTTESTARKTTEASSSNASNAASVPANRALVVAKATLGDPNGLPQKEVRPALKAENVYVLKNMLVQYGLPADVGWGVFFESIVSALIKLAEGSHDFTSHESVIVDYLKNCTLGHADPDDSSAALDRIDKGIRSIYFTLNENKRMSDQNLLMTGLLLAKYMNIQDEKSDRLNGITFVENGAIEKILEFVSRDQQTREKAMKADEIKKSRRP